MGKKIKRLPVCLLCMCAAAAYVVAGWLLGQGYYLLFPDGTDFYWAAEGVLDMILAALVFLVLLKLKKVHILKERGFGFWEGIKAGGFLVFMIVCMIVSGIAAGIAGEKSQQAVMILGFAFCMFAVGLSEELLFRGLIQNVLGDCFGRNSAGGIWLTAAASGAIFGMTHLFNIVSAGVTPLSGVMQAIAAVGVGIYFGAIYARCGNLWTMICLHALNDFAALMYSGAWGVSSVADTISSYGPEKLLSLVLYVGLAAFLLRRKKMAALIQYS